MFPWATPTCIPLATNGRNNPTQPPLVKRGGVVRSTFRPLSQQPAQDLCKRQMAYWLNFLPLSSRGRWGWGFALSLEYQTRIYNINKINMLYIIDFVGYFISIWFYCYFSWCFLGRSLPASPWQRMGGTTPPSLPLWKGEGSLGARLGIYLSKPSEICVRDRVGVLTGGILHHIVLDKFIISPTAIFIVSVNGFGNLLD